MKLCIDTFSGFNGYDDLLPKAKAAGFDGFFSAAAYALDRDRIAHCRALADRYELLYETSHSHIPGSSELWLADDPVGAGYADVLCRCIDNCREFHVPILVVHPVFPKDAPPCMDAGLSRLRRVVDYAAAAEVRLAFEDVTSYECLKLVLDTFRETHVGFCFDVGHNAVYMPDHNCLDEFGTRLFCTHIHDNPGDTDTHWLPFDGTQNFAAIAAAFAALGYDGCLSLEVRRQPCYAQMDGLPYLELALERLRRIRTLTEQAKHNPAQN